MPRLLVSLAACVLILLVVAFVLAGDFPERPAGLGASGVPVATGSASGPARRADALEEEAGARRVVEEEVPVLDEAPETPQAVPFASAGAESSETDVWTFYDFGGLGAKDRPEQAVGRFVVDVFGAAGEPQPGAKVELLWSTAAARLDASSAPVPFEHRRWRNNAAVPYVAAEGVADAEGRAVLSIPVEPDGGLWIRVRHPGWMPSLQRLGGSPVDGERFRVVLGAGAVLRGLVHGALPTRVQIGGDAAVVGRASVVAYPIENGKRRTGRWIDLDLEAAAPRSWELAGLVPGTYEFELTVRVDRRSDAQWKTIYELPRRLTLHVGSEVDVPIVLPADPGVFRCAMK